ncbi:MAG: hypothetical protein IT581_00280 [Verrucomicrobiales bacterium]|nr:hypothetical protein [Verrucomicrobiales bacterium]
MNAIIATIAPERSQGEAPPKTAAPPQPQRSTSNDRVPPLPDRRPQGSRGPTFSLSLLKDSLREVGFANYFLNRYEAELLELCPPVLNPGPKVKAPETPAKRATRLLDLLGRVETRVHADLGRIVTALEEVVVTELGTLEENVVSARHQLATEVIQPNLHLLKLEQDGGVKSPFQDLDVSGILDRLLQEPDQDEATMHQAERTLRACVAVQDLRANLACLRRKLENPATRQALESATRHFQETAKVWGVTSAPAALPGTHGVQLRQMSLLNLELCRRLERLAVLRPRVAAYEIADTELRHRIESSLPSLLQDDAAVPAIPALFSRSTTLGEWGETHGFLPVAQALRDVIARKLDLGEPIPPYRTPAAAESLPGQLTQFIRHQVQATMRSDAPLREGLFLSALAHGNRGIAERIAGIVTRLGFVSDLHQHRILMAAEAAELLRETLARVESGARTGADAEVPDRAREPIVALLESVLNACQNPETLVESTELETWIDDAFDYIRRRGALKEFRAQRAEYVERGWTTRSRQNRMEAPLKSGVPTALELGAIDAELGEVFEMLQADAELFFAEEGPPMTRALNALVEVNRLVADSLRLAPAATAQRLRDPAQSPVIAGLPAFLERVRSLGAGRGSRVETLDALVAELKALADQSPVFVSTPAADAALHLCQIAEMPPLELAGWTDDKGAALPLAACLPEIGWRAPTGNEGSGH